MQLQRKKFGGIGSRQKSDSFQERKCFFNQGKIKVVLGLVHFNYSRSKVNFHDFIPSILCRALFSFITLTSF